MQAPRLISVHVPKCAGSSLGTALSAAVEGALKRDYADRVADPTSRFNIDPVGFFADQDAYARDVGAMKAVHGHFHPAKYAAVNGAAVTTVLRAPLERALSHYFFWRCSPPNDHAVWRYVLKEELDFPAFCRLPGINRLMTDYFFRDYDIDALDWVGFSDAMDDYTEGFESRYGVRLALGRDNVTDSPDYAAAKARYLEDPAERAKLEPYFEADQRLYDRLRRRFG